MQPAIILSSTDRRTNKRRLPISSGPQPVCSACHTQFSRYTCPKCNFHYCSLACFRCQSHERCSEAFDRQSLLDEIHLDQTKNQQEKKAMLDMLRKFEQESLLEQEQEQDDTDDADQVDLESKLQGVDLDALSPDDLLALLSPSQREAFEGALQDPAKISALVNQEFQVEPPWWELKNQVHNDDDDDDLTPSSMPPALNRPSLPPLRLDAEGKPIVNPRLVYNIVAVLFSYTYVLRTFSLESFHSLPPHSTERNTCIDMLTQLVPFLVEKSTVVFDHVDAAVESVVSREDSDVMTPALIALLLLDVSSLLEPTLVSSISPSSSSNLSTHPFSNTLIALSDLHHLFSLASSTAQPQTTTTTTLPRPSLIQRPSSSTSRPKRTYHGATQKLAFYAAFLAFEPPAGATVDPPIDVRKMRSVSGRLRREALERQEEVEATRDNVQRVKERLEDGEITPVEDDSAGPRIVELK